MPHILVLGGTLEASALARALADAGLGATLSYMGRVDKPKAQPIPVRIGGFGGVPGLVAYLREQGVTHIVDATHPFAAQMSTNAILAARETGVPLLALTRPAWQPGPGDRWQRVPDMPAAVAALAGPPRRVLLAIGRMHLAEFAAQPQHHYLLRLVDDPTEAPPLPHHTVVVDRGPFSTEADRTLMQEHAIDLIVSKNAGGTG
ncbi:MAG: cobalt-precorrin-6A reductase, partial [Rhodobacteraceae bacterium]|nr:cobalt-precorrin-6A reductase [Paracoccaceae bacterium]